MSNELESLGNHEKVYFVMGIYCLHRYFHTGIG